MEKLSIIHIDMDAFFAAVEEKDNPQLKGHPVIVGGKSNHGIVTTANYQARKFGVHSAMPIFMAKQLCPHGIYVPGRMHRYREVSEEIFDIIHEYTDVVEPLSIDEAYLDVLNIEMEPLEIVKSLKRRVLDQVGLTFSAGISYNKFLAKLASDWNKPNGITVIRKEMVPEILLPLPVKKIYGIGKKSAKKLNSIGIYTVEDLMRLSEDLLIDMFGKYGMEIYERIRGIDRRKVEVTRERKSIGSETTFQDTSDREILLSYLKSFSFEIAQSLTNKNTQAKTVTVKIKYDNFQQHTKSRTLNNYISSQEEIYAVAENLFNEIELESKLRLIGLTVSNLMSKDMEQLCLFD